MRICSCHITGYGRLDNMDLDFDSGLNVFDKKNGWGKSTLCAFIKAMFYGGGDNDEAGLSERDKYRPWNHSAYGGSMVFEVGTKRYRVERFFGDGKSDDTFTIYDDKSGHRCDDYSDNLGEEIFGVDSESFTKSIYIPQSALRPKMTGAINGKLGDLVTLQDDINNYDEAIARIRSEIDIYTNDANDDSRGLSRKLRDEIDSLREDVGRLPSLEESLESLGEYVKDKNHTKESLEREKDELRARITKQSERDRLIGEYNVVVKNFESQKEDLDKLSEFFAGGIPTEDEIKESFEIAKEVDVLQRQSDDILRKMPTEEEMAKLKELFDEPLDEALIDDWTKRANKLSELRIVREHAKLSDEDKDALQELKYYFAKKKPTKEELDIVRGEAENLSILQGKVEETRGYYEQQRQLYESANTNSSYRPKSTLFMFIIISAIVLTGAISSLILVDDSAGIISGIVGIAIALVVIVFGVISTVRQNSSHKRLEAELENNYNDAKSKYEQTKSEYEASDKICKEFLGDFLVNYNDTASQMISDIELKAERYDALLSAEEKAVEVGSNALEELSELEVSLYTELMHYQVCYHMDDLYSTNAELELIGRIREDNRVYIEYFKDDKLRTKVVEDRETNFKKIASYLNRYPVIEGDTVTQKMAYIKAQKDQYEDLTDRAAENKSFIERFEADNDIDADSESIEEMQHRQADIDGELSALSEEINKAHIQISDVSKRIEECKEKSQRLLELSTQLDAYDKKVDYLMRTDHYLGVAKERFLSTYMGPMRRGMRKYIERIDTLGELIKSSDYTIDTNLNVSVVQYGGYREEEYLSKGHQDLAALCARLALIDIMYEEDKPMIILDDPFTNLDEDKIKMGYKLLEELSHDRQVLYFTCHSSRINAED